MYKLPFADESDYAAAAPESHETGADDAARNADIYEASAPADAPAPANISADDTPAPADDMPDGGSPSASACGLSLAEQALAARGGNTQASFSLDKLNPQQRQAVETTEGPVLVLAGAGTGKTRVLTTRIAYILARGLAWPSQILAVTFTNKAAAEMKERIAALIGDTQGMQWLGTFHSLGAKLLRIHAELAGLKPDFTILDSDDCRRLLKQLIRAENLDEKRWPARNLANLIDNWKNKGWTPAQVPAGDAQDFANGKGRVLYQAYQERLKTTNSCDFGDLLLLPILLFRQHPDILAKYQQKFRYILVDEYQDTNTAQYLWLRLLAQRPAGASVNLCCVGDDDQSIYGWRGAEVDNILRFEKDFKNATLIRLECNYRSTAPILATASYLIAHNKGRLGKTLFTERKNDDDAKVKLRAAWDSQEEARAIGDEIESLHSKGTALNNIAILVRAGFQTREFEERFGTIGLNYRIIGGPRFYERQEVRDAIAYLRLVAQPADDLAFERIINLPKRGLGDACLAKLHEAARREAVPMLAAADELIDGAELRPQQRKALRELAEDFRRWRSLLDKKPHTELAQIILDESGYTAMWQNDKAADAPARLENLKELVRSLENFESLRGFLEHIELVMELDRNKTQDAVSIMTLHAAKGLEFDTVFLPGWEEGLFPHQRALDEGGSSGLEEERRLAYVGLTRAKRREYIWFSQNRRIHGLWQNTLPSRFLDELPQDFVDVDLSENNFGGYAVPQSGMDGGGAFRRPDAFGSNYNTPGWQRARQNANEATRNNWGRRSGANTEMLHYGEAERDLRGTGGAPILEGTVLARGTATGGGVDGAADAGSSSAGNRGSAESASGNAAYDKNGVALSVGDRIFHLKFGNGTIAAAESGKLTIAFDKAGQKRLMAGFVEKL